jgi:hypothetical protein
MKIKIPEKEKRIPPWESFVLLLFAALLLQLCMRRLPFSYISY